MSPNVRDFDRFRREAHDPHSPELMGPIGFYAKEQNYTRASQTQTNWVNDLNVYAASLLTRTDSPFRYGNENNDDHSNGYWNPATPLAEIASGLARLLAARTFST